MPDMRAVEFLGNVKSYTVLASVVSAPKDSHTRIFGTGGVSATPMRWHPVLVVAA